MSAHGVRQVSVGTAPEVTSPTSLKRRVAVTNGQTRNRRLYVKKVNL
jgi:hypothetical protein